MLTHTFTKRIEEKTNQNKNLKKIDTKKKKDSRKKTKTTTTTTTRNLK